MATVDITESHRVEATSNTIIIKYGSVEIFLPANQTIVLAEENSNFTTIRSGSTLYKLDYTTNTNLSPINNNDYAKKILAKLRTQEVESKTAFGVTLSSKLTPVYQIKGIYDRVNSRSLQSFIVNNGSISNQNSQYLVTCGTNVGDYATLRSVRQINYKPGLGATTRFSGLFDTPVAGYNQIAGFGSFGNGLYFGYNGTSFGILREYGGRPEVRVLTITAAETLATNTSITLNGTTFVVPLTNAGGSTAFTAFEVGKFSYSGWNVSVSGSDVYFTATFAGPKNGVYAYTPAGTSTAAFGVVAGKSGVATTTEWITQNNWNGDKLDGTGPSGVILNPQRGNVFQIKFQWLGYGQIVFLTESPGNGAIIVAHSILYSNSYTTPSMEIPSLRSTFATYSIGGSGSQLTLKTSSFAGFLEGELFIPKILWSRSNTKTIPLNTETNILAIRSKIINNNIYNASEVFLNDLSIAADGNRNVVINIYLDPTQLGNNTTANYPQWTDLNINSIMQTDINTTTRTGGILLASVVIGKTDSRVFELLSDYILEPNQVIVFTATSAATSEVTIAVNWREIL